VIKKNDLVRLFSLAVVFVALSATTTVLAQDKHPRHPKEGKRTERQEEEKIVMPTPTPAPEKKDDLKMDMPADKSSHDGHKMDMPMNEKPSPTPTPSNTPSPFPLPPPGDDFPEPIHDRMNYGKVLIELLEYRTAPNGGNSLTWDSTGWYGGDYNRFWFRSEGEIEQSQEARGDVEFQALYGKLIRPFYDFQLGLRFDHKWHSGKRASRFQAVIGIDGIVPYEYEVEPLLFVSQDGDVSFRFTGTKDVFINQRTIFEGRIETNIAAQSVKKFGIGSGLNDIEFGFRVRREIRREFAPYVGVSYKRQFGKTADLARSEGERVDRFSIVAGVRMWF